MKRACCLGFVAFMICGLIWTALMIVEEKQGLQCFAKPDGSTYCFAPDGHIFRLRAERFRVLTEKRK